MCKIFAIFSYLCGFEQDLCNFLICAVLSMGWVGICGGSVTEGQLPRTAAPEQMALDDDDDKNAQLMRKVRMVLVMMMMMVFEMTKMNLMKGIKVWRDILWYHRWNYCPIQAQFRSQTDD